MVKNSKNVSNLQDKQIYYAYKKTRLRSQWDFVIQGYTAMRNDRGKGGGVATFCTGGDEVVSLNSGKET